MYQLFDIKIREYYDNPRVRIAKYKTQRDIFTAMVTILNSIKLTRNNNTNTISKITLMEVLIKIFIFI